MDDRKKRMRRMAVWTITVFATVFSVTMALLWLVVWPLSGERINSVGMALSIGWPIYLVVGLFCIAAFIAYRLYLDRKK
jgi:hypothetical protein